MCGRRAGKSFVLALDRRFLAAFHEYRAPRPGERGTVLVIATDRRQARIIMRYIRALLTAACRCWRAMVERESGGSFDLEQRVTIEVGTASFKTVRGYTIVAALLRRAGILAHGRRRRARTTRSSTRLRPGMATIPGAMLLCASSRPTRGAARCGTRIADTTARTATRSSSGRRPRATMNPTVPQRVIDEATERDPASAAAEYGAQFRSDIESFVSREAVEACVGLGVRERAPLSGVELRGLRRPERRQRRQHDAGRGATARTRRRILDAVRERRPPFSPEDVVAEFAALLQELRRLAA